MDNFEGSYAPQSPDLSGVNNGFDEPPPTFANTYYPTAAAPHYQQQQPAYALDQSHYPQNTTHVTSNSAKTQKGTKKSRAPEMPPTEEVCDKPAPGVEEGIEVKTKFPVARIKRIMQADEDVGKVAQVTPTAVSKALELFMISIVTKAADVAQAKSSRRVTAQNLKQALEHDEQFDFLADIIAKVPDAASTKKKDETEESDEGGEVTKKKKKGPTRRKTKDEDDD